MSKLKDDPSPGIRSRPGLAGAITWRAVALGAFLTIFLAVAAPYSDFLRRSPLLIGNHLPLIVITVITLLSAVINPLLGSRRFTATEMITAISMMLIAGALPTSGLFRYFTPQLASTVYHATGGQLWYLDYLRLLPDWMLPSKDPASSIIRDYYLGADPTNPNAVAASWGPWARPYLAWALFLGPLFLFLIFLCALLRKQWVERERLSFPMATIPLEMMQDPEPGRRFAALWRNPLLWVAVLVPFAFHLLNGAHIFYPSVPEIPLKFDWTNTILADYPWNQLPYFMRTASVSFTVVAITFFIPLDVAFSMWFFFFLYNFVILFFTVSGVEVKWDYRIAHTGGMWLTYGLIILWLARHHLLHVARAVWRWEPREPDEPLSYRACAIGLLVCASVAIGFLIAGGMTWWLAIGVFFTLVLWSMIITRIIIESGLALICYQADPLYLWNWLLPGVSTGATKIIWMRNWMIANIASRGSFADAREQLMPFAANTLRMGSALPASQRFKHLCTLIGALTLCAIVSGGAHHYMNYAYGRQQFDDEHSTTNFAQYSMDGAKRSAEPEISTPQVPVGAHVAGGAAAMLLVCGLRAFTTSMPLHPIGLLLLNTYSGDRLWLSIMIGWAINLVILRWGGLRLFQTVRPIFIGLLVGDSLAGVFWAFVGLYASWPANVRYEILFK